MSARRERHMVDAPLHAGGTYELMLVPPLEELKESLFGSTYSASKSVVVHINEGVSIPVVVTTARAAYEPFPAAEGAVGCFEHPDYEFEGWVVKSGFDPYPEVVRVLIRVIVGNRGEVEGANIQRMT